MVYPVDSPSCAGVTMSHTRDVFQSILENQDKKMYSASENSGMVQTTEVSFKGAIACDSETSTLVDFACKNGGSLETSNDERETSTSETDTAYAQMLDADERAWDSPSLTQDFEHFKAIVLAMFSLRGAA